MGKLVEPKAYLVGYTTIDFDGMNQYLQDTGNESFRLLAKEAMIDDNLELGEVLTSFYAKLCYASLSEDKNENVKKIRGIADNLKAAIDSGHGSVFEHVTINFVVTNCSRVFTHELVRHRVGTAFSQTSGRYVRGKEINIVFDPVLEPVKDEVLYLQGVLESTYAKMVAKMDLDNMTDFAKKKQITSALRRILPNGQSNEIGVSLNLRSIRHTMEMRTSRHAEWEIRFVFDQIYHLLKDRYPLLFYGAEVGEHKGLVELTNLRI